MTGYRLCPHCGQEMIPPDEALQEAEARIRRLDILSPLCAWDKFDFQLTHDQRQARVRWQQIMAIQGEFEERYC